MATPSLSLAALRKGLFTHEDTFNVHKMLGLPCLAHFIWRTLSVPFRPFGDMGFDASRFTRAEDRRLPLKSMH